jgi:hypothetical protein
MSEFVAGTGMKVCVSGLVLMEGQRQGYEAEALEGQILIDWLLLELMREVAVSATVGMLAEFPLGLVWSRL